MLNAKEIGRYHWGLFSCVEIDFADKNFDIITPNSYLFRVLVLRHFAWMTLLHSKWSASSSLAPESVVIYYTRPWWCHLSVHISPPYLTEHSTYFDYESTTSSVCRHYWSFLIWWVKLTHLCNLSFPSLYVTIYQLLIIPTLYLPADLSFQNGLRNFEMNFRKGKVTVTGILLSGKFRNSVTKFSFPWCSRANYQVKFEKTWHKNQFNFRFTAISENFNRPG